jgi:cytochrome c553
VKRTLLTLVGLVAVLGLGVLLVAWSGIYSVAASEGHWALTRWFLAFGMRNSVETHTLGVDPPPLDDPALILRGAGHYQGGCAACHGAPGEARNPIVRSMLPEPPYLVEQVRTWDPDELFWIVKHGLKYTGMPAWVAQRRDDEVWAVVAFLRRLPDLSPREYQRLARGESESFGRLVAENPRVLALTGPLGASLAACARCHEADGSGRGVGAFPRLAGQSAPYLQATLENYASGARASGIMQPVAAALTDDQIEALAKYYAAQEQAPYPPVPEADREALELGFTLAMRGLADDGIPGCASCHGPGQTPRNPLYPALAGQYADYLALQLRLFKQGVRGGTPYAEIMKVIGERLTEEQIRAVALYYASLRPRRAAEAPQE